MDPGHTLKNPEFGRWKIVAAEYGMAMGYRCNGAGMVLTAGSCMALSGAAAWCSTG